MSKCQFEMIFELTAVGEYNGREVTFAARPVQEMIRCKDCVYYSDEYGSCGRTDIIRSDMRIIMPDWYCADGKRKDASNESIK